jgi:hypothetical protein
MLTILLRADMYPKYEFVHARVAAVNFISISKMNPKKK